MATLLTYAAVGIREDLIDMITNISPTDTPVTSMTGSVRATNRYHEWTTQALKSPGSSPRVEGAVSTSKTVTPRVRTGNYTEIIDNVFAISNTQNAVKIVGGADEEAEQNEIAIKELARDIEFALIVNSASVSGGSATGRKLKGINGWVATNASTAGVARALTAALIDAQLKAAWAQGGKPDVILTGGTQKIAMTNSTNFPNITKNVQASVGEYKNFVDIYQGGIGGTLKVVTSTIMDTSLSAQIFLLEIGKFRKAWLRAPKKEKLAYNGGSQAFAWEAELTLESLNEKASAVVKNLS